MVKMGNEVVAIERRFYRICVDLLTDVRKMLKVFLSKSSRIIIKTSKLIKEISPTKLC